MTVRQEESQGKLPRGGIFNLSLTGQTEVLQVKKVERLWTTWIVNSSPNNTTVQKLSHLSKPIGNSLQSSLCPSVKMKTKMPNSPSFLICLPDTEKCSLIPIHMEKRILPTWNRSTFHGSACKWDTCGVFLVNSPVLSCFHSSPPVYLDTLLLERTLYSTNLVTSRGSLLHGAIFILLILYCELVCLPPSYFQTVIKTL